MANNQAKEQEAGCIQFIIGEISSKIENTRIEIRKWMQMETKEGWIDIHIQFKKQYLKELFKQKIMFTEGVNNFIQTGIILYPHEIYAKSERMTNEDFEFKLEEMLDACLSE